MALLLASHVPILQLKMFKLNVSINTSLKLDLVFFFIPMHLYLFGLRLFPLLSMLSIDFQHRSFIVPLLSPFFLVSLLLFLSFTHLVVFVTLTFVTMHLINYLPKVLHASSLVIAQSTKVSDVSTLTPNVSSSPDMSPLMNLNFPL